MSQPLNIIVVKTKDKIFITDNIENKSYFSGQLASKLINGKYPKSSFVSYWYIVDDIPKTVHVKHSSQQINQRYELKEEFQVTELTPKVIYEAYIDEDSDYYNVRGLYDRKYELTEETLEDIEFQLTVYDESNAFVPDKINFSVKYNLLDMLQTYPVLLPSKPCRLSAEESYKIIRAHVKANIDPNYADVTKDYDFCFTVKKKIRLSKDEPFQYDVNSILWRKKKPKYETRYRKYSSIEVYNVAPKPYDKYSVVVPFEGKNYEDLQDNINKFLYDLMEEINKPYVECPHCSGAGVILKKERE